jgi:hypothetical protein
MQGWEVLAAVSIDLCFRAAFATTRTCRDVCYLAAFGGKADVPGRLTVERIMLG